MSMAPGSPSVQSSSFNSYSSGPASVPSGSTSGIGTTEWFKEHALLILLGVVALVAVLWYLSKRGGSGATLSPDTGYPLGYPSVSGGSGASSGGAGAADTGTAATTDTTTALDAFVKGFQLRDGQITPQNVAGPTGPTGVAGAAGAVGATGATGATGAQGIQGTQGATGTPFTTKEQTKTMQLTAPQVQHLTVATSTPIIGQVSTVARQAQAQTGIPAAGSTIGAAIKALPKPSTGTHAATTKPTPTKKPPAPTKKAAPIGHTKGHEGVY